MVFIGHGLTSDTRSSLIDGAMDAVITQNQLNTMMSCIAIFNNLRAGRSAMHGIEAPRSEIIFRENIPEFWRLVPISFDLVGIPEAYLPGCRGAC